MSRTDADGEIPSGSLSWHGSRHKDPRTMALTWRWNNRRSSIINLKAAKQIGLAIPPNVFAISGELAGKIQDFDAHLKKRREKGADDTQ